MTVGFEIGLVVLLILLNAFFAASEMALVTVRKARLRDLTEKRVRGARVALRLVENPGRFLATIQVGVTTAGFFASAVGAVSLSRALAEPLAASGIPWVSQQADAISFVVVTTLITYLSLVIGELVPKNMAIHWAEQLALFVAPIVDLVSRVARPVVAFLTLSTNAILRLFGIRGTVKPGSVTQDEIESMVNAGEEEGSIESEEAEMIKGVFELGETKVREIMRPRLDIVAVPLDATLQQTIALMLESGKSRLPVYKGTIDDVVGLISAKDLLRHFGGDLEEISLPQMMRAPVYVPEGKAVDDLLQEMKRTRQHMAIVLDEFGGTAGLVTLEDIVEEVVGEIEDETDVPQIEIQRVDAEEVIVNGRVGIDEVNDLLEIQLEKVDFDSVGGLVMHELGRLPASGDRLELEEATVEVLTMKGNRIEAVRIRRLPQPHHHDNNGVNGAANGNGAGATASADS